jgi:hypothetical protein
MQENTVTRLQTTRVQTPLPPSIKCNVLRQSLAGDSQNIPCATLKRMGVVGNLYLSLLFMDNICLRRSRHRGSES